MRLIDLTIEELGKIDYACSCGHHHHIGIEQIAIEEGAIKKLPDFLKEQKKKDGTLLSQWDKILVTADVNTWKAAGEEVFELIKSCGWNAVSYIFPYKEMHTEETHIQELKQQVTEDVALMIAVGSGTMNDLNRYVSFQKNIPYYIVGTAPSMDGYASNVSPVILNHLKVSCPAHCAAAIIGDTAILAKAPKKMIAAGIGDILAKFLDINDWYFSKLINGESYCEEVAELMIFSTEKCISQIDGLKNRKPEAFQALMESLVMIGIAMAYVGSSRPGSAAEHSMAHVMEMQSIFKGGYGELHGTCVGMATCMITKMYEYFLSLPMDYEKARQHANRFCYDRWKGNIEKLFQAAAVSVFGVYEKTGQNEPKNVIRRIEAIQKKEKEVIERIQKTVERSRHAPEWIGVLGGKTNPKEFGFTREEFREILLYSKEQRDRYAALQFFYDMGLLEELTEEIIEENNGQE